MIDRARPLAHQSLNQVRARQLPSPQAAERPLLGSALAERCCALPLVVVGAGSQRKSEQSLSSEKTQAGQTETQAKLSAQQTRRSAHKARLRSAAAA